LISHIKEILRRYYKYGVLITAKPFDRSLVSELNERHKIQRLGKLRGYVNFPKAGM
jgi:hypothetical protein